MIKKKIYLVIGGAIFAAFLVVYLFWHALLDHILESSIGVPVRFTKIHLKLFPIEFGVYDVKVKNLKGFRSPRMASIPEIYFRMEPLDLLRGKIHVDEIRVHIDEIVAERNTHGKVNLVELQKKLTPAQPPPPLPNLQIDRVTLTMTRVQYIDYNFTPPITKIFFLNIYNASLEDVTNPRRVTEQVITIALKKIGMKIVTSQINKATATFADQARATLSNLLGAKT